MATTDKLEMIRFDELKEKGVARDRKTLKAWMGRKDDPFPRPLRIGIRAIAWRKSSVEAWLERREAAAK